MDYPKGEVERLFTTMDAEKGDLKQRSERNAGWTIPSVCPLDNMQQTDQVSSYITIGPRLVNTLSNKIVDAMFPQSRPFFTLSVQGELQARIRQEAGEEALATMNSRANSEARWLEGYALQRMNLVKYRPKAVEAIQHLTVTGNVVIRRLDNDERAVYGIKDFGCRRDIAGNVYDLVLRDAITYDELPDNAKAVIGERTHTKQLDETYEYNLYTRYYRVKNTWHTEQEVCGVRVGGSKRYSNTDRPFIDLVWVLPRGYNYARSLVDEYANTFHSLNIASEAQNDIIQLLADIKWIVSPTSMIDVVRLNNSRRGSYHAGSADDVKALAVEKSRELSAISAVVQMQEQELARAFLLQAGATRDAERVTAYEVQLAALELETAFGGLYSRLALMWQQKEAEYLIANLDLKLPKNLFDIRITTGIESLSREGALAAFRSAVMDLQLMEAMPEEIRGVINPTKVANFVFGNRGINFDEFSYTAEELEQKRAAAMQEQQQLLAAQAASTAASRPENTQ